MWSFQSHYPLTPNKTMVLRYLFALLVIIAYQPSYSMANDDIDWGDINTIGLLNGQEDGQLSDDLWDGYSQDEALRTLSHFPKTLRSPAYKFAVRKLLLSSSPKLKGDIDSPKFLAKRIEMLIQYGLFDDAQNLYDMAGDNKNSDFDLALMGVALTMTRDELPSACLDIKTLSNQFQNMPAWRELSNYCTARFGGKKSLSADSLSFKKYPLLSYLLTEQIQSMPFDASVIETLIAFSDKRVSNIAYEKNARRPENATDLFIKMALNDSYTDNETYQCYAIESAVRGMSDKEQLITFYNVARFDESMLEGQDDAVRMHPCDVPAFFYQRVTTTNSPELEIPILLESTKGISPHAYAPFASYIKDHYDLAGDHGWKASVILALNGQDIGKTPVNAPIRFININESMPIDDAIEWKKSIETSPFYQNNPFDFARSVYISRSNSGDFNSVGKNKDKYDYEKLLHSGLGIHNALSTAIDDDNFPRVLLITMSGLGQYKPNDVHVDAITGILSSFGKLKLDKEKHTLAIEALH
jgi:hypothetical protein